MTPEEHSELKDRVDSYSRIEAQICELEDMVLYVSFQSSFCTEDLNSRNDFFHRLTEATGLEHADITDCLCSFLKTRIQSLAAEMENL